MNRSLVLLHGFTGSPESWAPVLDLLPGDTRVAVPPLLGHGANGVPADTFEQEIDRLAQIAARLSAPRHLAGYSLGARLALGMLVRHTELFAGATLIGVNPGLASTAERDERARADHRWVTLLEKRDLDTFLAEWRALPMWTSQRDATPDRLDAQARINRAHDPLALALSLRVLGLAAMPDWTPWLDRIDVPVTLMTGALDAKFTALADAMVALLPRARRLTIAAAGHNLLLERPDAVAHALNQDAWNE